MHPYTCIFAHMAHGWYSLCMLSERPVGSTIGMLKSFFSQKSINDYHLLNIKFFSIVVSESQWRLVAPMYCAAVRSDAAVHSRRVVERQAYKQTGQTRRLNRLPLHVASNSSFTLSWDETMPHSFSRRECWGGRGRAACSKQQLWNDVHITPSSAPR